MLVKYSCGYKNNITDRSTLTKVNHFYHTAAATLTCTVYITRMCFKEEKGKNTKQLIHNCVTRFTNTQANHKSV